MLLFTLFYLVAAVAAIPAPQADSTSTAATNPSQTSSASSTVCTGNTAEDRSVWCDYSIDTNWYIEPPDTGVVREYWLDVTNTTLAPDGVERIALAINGSIPGPTLEANWGDTFRIHVRNSLSANGTGIHWHGIRQNHTVQEDGVPSITQCPIAPGESMTYTFRATQYGTSWYHSHYSLQAWDGVVGPLVIHGPATANYDEELDTIFLLDWSHATADSLYTHAQVVGPPLMENGLINGKNTYNGSGSRYEASVEAGKSYRIRLINGAIDTHFKFSLDNHNFTVIANDFVPLVPFTTNVIDITMGQRYDIIFKADQDATDYWMRAIPQSACSHNANSNDIRGILRYDSTSTSAPNTSAWSDTVDVDACVDVPLSNLVPYLSQTVTNPTKDDSDLDVTVFANSENLFKWKIGLESMLVEWAEPSLMQIFEGNVSFEDDDCVYSLPNADEWVYFVIETAIPVPHPIHLHGHDFFVLAAAEDATFDDDVTLNLENPPRRDVANLPASGYLVIAFLTDNPGAWLMHCHIGWHTSEGLALQFIERESEIAELLDGSIMQDTCDAWDAWANAVGIEEEDSGV